MTTYTTRTKPQPHRDGDAAPYNNASCYDRGNRNKPKNSFPASEPEEIIIAVMGATGSGKSTFINLLSGSKLAVGEGLKSCTTTVQTSDTFEMNGKSVTLIDTPGFDDTTVSDTDILKMIAVYLSSTYQSGRMLNGLIYMHRITDIRVGGVSRRNMNMFRKLCGDQTLQNVALVTNMWREITLEVGAARENELRTDELLFKPILDQGAAMLRHDGGLASALAILAHLADNRPQTLCIQRELVDERKDITETAAGKELDQELAMLRQKHVKELEVIQEMMDQALAQKDEHTKRELEEARAELLESMQRIEQDRERLSKEYADEKARADDRVRQIEEALEAEKAEREKRQREIARLQEEMESSRVTSAAEREAMEQQLQELKSQQSHGGFFSRFGRTLDALFGII